MPGRYIDVVVEDHPEIPEGCEMRFHAVGEARVVQQIHYEPLLGRAGEFEVLAAGGGPAWAVPVDDSGAGTSVLIYGDARGLRLRRLGGADDQGDPVAEPYLLLTADSIVD
jgi:hypothetical protein